MGIISSEFYDCSMNSGYLCSTRGVLGVIMPYIPRRLRTPLIYTDLHCLECSAEQGYYTGNRIFRIGPLRVLEC